MSEKLHYDSNDRDEEALESCPFCGGEADLRIYEPPFCRQSYYVSCQKCGAMTKPAPNKELALALWKKRQGRKARFPQAHWEPDSDGLPVCSKCGEIALQRAFVKVPNLIQDLRLVRSKYCPNCGADMKEAEHG